MIHLFLAFMLLAFAAPAQAERRVALVVGNAAYAHATPLKNPARDAAAVAATLRELDFEVLAVTDLDKIGLEQTLKRFARLSAGADVALFYYSGHAISVDEQNYLLPVSANIGGAADLPLEAVGLQDVGNVMAVSGVKAQLLVLDACRNNPFAARLQGSTRSARAAGSGLSAVAPTTGALVAFSTSPGMTALDGDGDLSPFTASFVRRALEPKLEIRQALTKIRNDVIAATDGRQTPWDNSSLRGDLHLVPLRPPPVFDKLTLVAVPRAEAAAASSLRLQPPKQPEGGEVSVALGSAPRWGRLSIGGRTVGAGDRITPAEFGELTYQCDRPDAPQQDAFSFKVRDAWGHEEDGHVAIALDGGALRPPAPAEPVALGRIEAVGTSVLGLGPNLRLKDGPPPAGPAGGQWIRLSASVPAGELILGSRKLDSGKSVQVADLSRLAFLPAGGSEGRTVEALFAAEAPATGEVRLRIEVEMHACDRLAGDRFDAQGVADGVLSGNIDLEKAAPACEAAVKAHPTTARFHHQLARVRLAQVRHPEALAGFGKAADLGHVRSHVSLGYMHAVGLGTLRDEARAKAEYERAAEGGDAFGIHALGKLHYDGRGVPRDFVKARELFERSARIGHTYSMNALGLIYRRGEGVEADLGVTRRYWQESAARDDIYGLHNMGYAYLEGIGGERDLAQALDLFKKAADRGHPEAPNSIGRLFLAGEVVPLDLGVAAKWYRLGAERGDGWAALNLGDLQRQGKGVPVDLVEAAASYARAAAFYGVEPARLARARLAPLARTSKVEALKRLAAKLDSRPLPAATEAAILARAVEAVGRQGVSADPKRLDDLLVAAAKAEWDRTGARADLF